MHELIKKVERAVTYFLAGRMAVVVVLAVGELAWIIVEDIITPPVLILEIDELLDIFGIFMLVLIGVELLETIKAYIRENVIHGGGADRRDDRHGAQGHRPRPEEPAEHDAHWHCSHHRRAGPIGALFPETVVTGSRVASGAGADHVVT